jgi:hypothetical protein
MKKLLEIARRIRRGCYSIKVRLTAEDRRLFDELNQAVDDLEDDPGPAPRKLWLVVIKDKELYGEPDVGVGLIEADNESAADNAGARMLEALAVRGRCRCVARKVEIEPGRFYRSTAWFRTGQTELP